MNKIKIFLTEEEAKKWVEYQKHYKTFLILLENKLFDIGYGKAILNFANGELQNLTKDEIVWRKDKIQ